MAIELSKLECPSCGAGLRLSHGGRAAECDSCGGVFLISRENSVGAEIISSAPTRVDREAKIDGERLADIVAESVASSGVSDAALEGLSATDVELTRRAEYRCAGRWSCSYECSAQTRGGDGAVATTKIGGDASGELSFAIGSERYHADDISADEVAEECANVIDQNAPQRVFKAANDEALRNVSMIGEQRSVVINGVSASFECEAHIVPYWRVTFARPDGARSAYVSAVDGSSSSIGDLTDGLPRSSSSKRKRDGTMLCRFLTVIALVYLGALGMIAFGEPIDEDIVGALFGLGTLLGVAPFVSVPRVKKLFSIAVMVLHAALLAFAPSMLGAETAGAVGVREGALAFGVVFLVASFVALRRRRDRADDPARAKESIARIRAQVAERAMHG